MSTYIDIHVLQTVPPSNLNRDDAGTPKSAVYGGVRRLRVSSQSWKRAARLSFADHLDASKLGTRTKRVLEVLAQDITRQAPDLESQAVDLATDVFKAAKIKLTTPRTRKDQAPRPDESGYLLFLSTQQIQRLASLAVTAARTGEKLDAKAVKETVKNNHSVDIALFGRMVADDADLNVDAACQVAHALSVHAAETEFDFFTAVDDAKKASEEEDAGAGMMGTVEFSSATLYRYATINLDLLRENLGDNAATLEAVRVFVDAFALSMPTGKQNTFANRTVPDLVAVQVREDQPVSLVGAFEQPVTAPAGQGYVTEAVKALAAHEARIEEAFGLTPARSLVVSLNRNDDTERLGEALRFSDLAETLTDELAGRLPQVES